MTYFLLSITNKCGKACGYCVVKPWRNNPDFPDKVTAEDLTAFLGKELQAGDAVELTGGEPTMFPGLQTLLAWLKEHGAKVILRTNGLHLGEWRKSYYNLVVVLAKHDSDTAYMNERKKHLLPCDLVLDGIPDGIKQKEPLKPVFKPDGASPANSHPFNKMMFITNDGKIRFAPCCDDDMGTVWGYKPALYHCCRECPYMLGAWNLINRIGKTFKEEDM